MCEQDQRTVQHDGRKVTRNFERHLDFTPDLPMLEEHTVARLSQTSPNRHYKSLAIRQIVLCSSARSITAATMPSFLGRGATTLLAAPLLDIRSPMHAGDSCGLAYCISDQLRAGNTPIFLPSQPRPRQ